MLQFQLASIKFGQVENVVEQFDQDLARVVGNGQLLVLLGIQRAVQAQRQHAQHAQQAIERGADFVAHIGQECRAGLGHFQCRAARSFQLFIGVTQLLVDCFQLLGAL